MAVQDIECCDFYQVHEDVVKAVKDKMPEDGALYDLAELFKVFGDSTRIRILYVLFESEMCVCDIAQLLSMTQSAISHQLRILKQSKLVKSRREGSLCFIPWQTAMYTALSTRALNISANRGAQEEIQNKRNKMRIKEKEKKL